MMTITEFIEKGKELAARGEHAAAARFFRQALDRDPESEQALFELGKTQYILREYRDAEEVLKKLFARTPSNIHVPLLLGKTFKETGKAKQAAELFEAVVKKGALSGEVYRELGGLYKNEKEYELACVMFERFLETAPGDAEVRMELIQLYNFTGRRDRAGGKARQFLEGAEALDAHLENRLLSELEIADKKTVLGSKPRIMLMTLTNRCNLKCPMCGRAKDAWDIPERLRDELIGYLPYLELITWQGGEVFLYPHFRMLLNEARKNRKLKQIIITNGLLIGRQWAGELISAGNIDLTISIDSTRKETYEKLRFGGSFEKLIENIRVINELRERSSSRMGLTLRCAIMKDNYEELDDFLEFAKEYRFNVLLIFPISGEKDPANIFVTRDRKALAFIQEARARLERKAREYGIRLLNWLPREPFEGSEDEARAPAAAEQRAPEAAAGPAQAAAEEVPAAPLCLRPWRQIAVNVAGEIYPECLCPLSAGTVFRDSFKEIWNGSTMQEYRRRLAQGDCRQCGEACRSGVIPPEHLKFICG
ncbi:MAG: radical SAM protein [Endomicrobiales bacterium]